MVGTSNGTTGDAVDLYCTNGVGTTFTTTLIKAAVPVAAGGGFTYSGDPTGTKARACVIRAFPAAATGPAPDTNLATFTGPRVYLGEEQTYRGNLGLYDYYVFNSQTQGGMDYESLGSCGLDDSFVYDPPRWPRAARSSTATSTSRTATARRPPPRARSSSSTDATPTRPTRRTTSTPGPRRPPASSR